MPYTNTDAVKKPECVDSTDIQVNLNEFAENLKKSLDKKYNKTSGIRN